MIINNSANVAETQGISGSVMEMEMNAKMYDIFLDKMYTNKVGSVLRELASNAWDSHVTAGTANKPFDVELPSWLDKNFSIRDYGTGIPHDEFKKIYTTIGRSTKDEDNQQIGGFGIGSKSFFALTDMCTVENIQGNRKTTWLCYRDGGFPHVDKLSDEITQEPSGLRVAFSFSSDLKIKFEREIVKQLAYFPVKPRVLGETTIKWQDTPDLTQGYAYSDGISGHTIVMGNVNYPLNMEDLGIIRYSYKSTGNDLPDNKELLQLLSQTIILDVPLGSVDITSSREALSMTERTKDYLLAKLRAILATYKAAFEKELCKLTDEVPRKLWVSKQNLDILDYKRGDVLILRDGTPLEWLEIKDTSIDFAGMHSCRHLNARYKMPLRSHHGTIEANMLAVAKFYINDLYRNQGKHLMEELDQFTTGYATNTFFIDAQDTYNKQDRAKDALALQQELKLRGIIALRVSDIIGFPAALAKSVTAKKTYCEPNQVFKVIPRFSSQYSMQKAITNYTEEDLPTTGYYVEITGWKVKDNVCTLDNLAAAQALLGDVPLYLVRSKSVKKLGDGIKPLHVALEMLASKAKRSLIKGKQKDYRSNEVKDLSSFESLVTKDTDLSKYIKLSNALAKRKTLYYAEESNLRELVLLWEPEYRIPPVTTSNKLQTLLDYYQDNYGELFTAMKRAYRTDIETAVEQLNTLINKG